MDHKANAMNMELKIQGVQAAPAVTGAVYSAITFNEVVMVLTGVYVLLQIAYLIWKWRREIKVDK